MIGPPLDEPSLTRKRGSYKFDVSGNCGVVVADNAFLRDKRE